MNKGFVCQYKFTIIAFLAISLCVSGCTVTYRGRGNRSIWRTRLPSNPTYKDVVFFLESPPKAEFAFLLAQKYPESYVICSPIITERGSMYVTRESHVPYEWTYAKPGDKYVGKINFKRVEIPITSETLSQNLVFHEMKVTSCDRLPDVFQISPHISLFWKPEGPRYSGTNNTPSALMLPYLVAAVFGVNPPEPHHSITGHGRQSLVVTINQQDQLQFIADDDAERGAMIGFWFYVPISVFFPEVTAVSMEESSSSPGGWADCLEKMFSTPAVINAGGSIDSATSLAKSNEFDRQFAKKGFELLPGVNSADSKPSICLFAKDGERYFWQGYRDGYNHLISTAPVGFQLRQSRN